MLSSKATGWMLVMGIVGFVIMTVSQFVQGDQDGTAGVVAWAATNSDWEGVGMMRLLTAVFMLVFTAGFISWARSINESNSVINIGTYFAFFGLILLWMGIIVQLTGFEVASENTAAAYPLIELSNMGMWFGGVNFAISFFLVGIGAYKEKAGTPALNGILAILGFIAAVGSFITWFLWLGGFGLGLLLLAVIGVQQVIRGRSVASG